MLKALEGSKLVEHHMLEPGSHYNSRTKGVAQQGSLGGAKKKKQKKKSDKKLLDESFEYEKVELTTKMEVGKEEKVEFEGIYCERSFYLFAKSAWFRQLIYKVVSSTRFEGVILALIIFSSLKLVVDTYIFDLPDTNPIVAASTKLDFFFTAAFATESLIKSLAFGLCFDDGSYLREVWNQLDFAIVTVSIIDATSQNINLPVVKILRLFRTLRPLRFISHNSGMKTIVMALVQSVGGIFNVAIVVVIVWLMFAILAVNLFGGKLWSCTVDPYTYSTRLECLEHDGEWVNSAQHYDNIPAAMLTLFSLATMENFPDYMYNTINSQGVDLGPKIDGSPYNGYFFVVFVLIGSFLFLNLFVGVIFKEFEDAQKEERASLMLKD